VGVSENSTANYKTRNVSNERESAQSRSSKTRSTSKYGTPNKTTKTYYKSGELKMEKLLDKMHQNLILYYKNGKEIFTGTITKGTSVVEDGSWYYPNGQLYYCGTFNKQGFPEGEKCCLYNEDGSKKFQGKIIRCMSEVSIPAKKIPEDELSQTRAHSEAGSSQDIIGNPIPLTQN
jgi:antitoxin component YwqK of YwqJK toxin-antitoxin module